MIYLCNEEQSGQAVYFDLHQIRTEGGGYVLGGTIGDGLYEGEVQIDLDETAEVTFLDRFLAPTELSGFFGRVERGRVERCLLDAAREMTFCVQSFPMTDGRPSTRVTGFRHGGSVQRLRPATYGEQQELPLFVSSGEPAWAAAL